MFLLKIIILNFLFFNTLNHLPKDKDIFRAPLKIPVFLSANFGELRIDHFHSGVDLKTQGTTGQEVVAAGDGYIYRITVSPQGFGKALYIRHPSGYSTVYGHLDRFLPGIEEYVRTQQYENKSFLVNLFPSRDKFRVMKGDLIAYSGNSGSSGGPHLHFEIREADSELPVNPLLFEIGTTDDIPPVIEKIAIFPAGRGSFINNRRSTLKVNVTGSKGKYSMPAGKEIMISGSAGFGIKVHDLLNGSYNRCAAYSIELMIDSLPVFRYVMDGFPFTESRYVNSHIDYETFMKDNTYIERAFVLPNDKLGNYKSVLNRGIYNFRDNKLHKVEFLVKDVSGNKSSISFNVRSTVEKPGEIAEAADQNLKMMPYNRTNRFTSDGVAISIPDGALYDTLWFDYKKHPGTPVMLSDLHSVHNEFTPVQKAFRLSIKTTRNLPGKESKMLIVRLNENMSKTPATGTWSEGFVTADVASFGNYFVGIDTTAPVISAGSLADNADLRGKKELRLKISDDFSGIRSYEPTIDGKWALFEYDPKNSSLTYKFDSKYLTKGIKHSLSVKVTDNRDNETRYSCDFIW